MYRIIIQYSERFPAKSLVPSATALRQWAKAALKQHGESAEVTIRLVDIEEMSHLNETYRHKTGPTNVLSFPLVLPEEVTMDVPPLGDIVICADVVEREAKEQSQSLEAHWAHMVVHGIFHLLGYDHQTEQDANVMESLEVAVMAQLGFANPYDIGENITAYD